MGTLSAMATELPHLIWIDCEMTGLDLATDALVEIAVLVTDSELNVIGEGVDVVIHATQGQLDAMNDFVKNLMDPFNNYVANVEDDYDLYNDEHDEQNDTDHDEILEYH